MRIKRLLLTGLVLMCLLASCANDDSTVSTAKTAVVSLSLSTKSTRTSGTSLPTGTGLINETEGTLSRVCLCFYKSSTGKVITLSEYTSPSSTISSTTTTDADSVYVIVNAPSGAFSGQTTIAGVRTAIQNLNYTTYSGSATAQTTVNSQNTNYLPMVDREATGVSSTTTSSAVSVSLKRLVSRVALTGITVNFSSTGAFSSATFTPTEIFMYNANNQLTLEGACTSSSNDIGVASGLVTAEYTDKTTTSGTPSALGTNANYVYLSSGFLNLSNSTSYLSSSPYYFYVYPNAKTSSPTKLVIKGWFYDGSTTSIVYYPIKIDHTQTGTSGTSGNESVAANTCYNISTVIKGKGSSGPDDDITPATASSTITITSWTTNTESVTFE